MTSFTNTIEAGTVKPFQRLCEHGPEEPLESRIVVLSVLRFALWRLVPRPSRSARVADSSDLGLVTVLSLS